MHQNHKNAIFARLKKGAVIETIGKLVLEIQSKFVGHIYRRQDLCILSGWISIVSVLLWTISIFFIRFNLKQGKVKTSSQSSEMQ